jgi:hypothetical protein
MDVAVTGSTRLAALIATRAELLDRGSEGAAQAQEAAARMARLARHAIDRKTIATSGSADAEAVNERTTLCVP